MFFTKKKEQKVKDSFKEVWGALFHLQSDIIKGVATMGIKNDAEQTIQQIEALLIAAKLNPIPVLTKLLVIQDQVNEANAVIAQIEKELQDAATMAENDLQGEESRLAGDEHRGAYQFERDALVPPADGTPDERLGWILQKVQQLKRSVNQAPPAPPTPTAPEA